MIPKDSLVHNRIYLGVYNRLGGVGKNERWEQELMVWVVDGWYGQDSYTEVGVFYPLSALANKPWPPSPYDYYDPDSRFATFIPIRDTGEDYKEEV